MKDVGKLFGHLVYFTAMSNILFSGGTLVSTWSILQPFGLFCSHLVYFTAIWSILQPFGLFYSHLVYFTAISYILWPFWYFVARLLKIFV
jgi:hypothetical protein